MRKILNPFALSGNPEFRCIGCSPNNDIGLHLTFWEDGDSLVSFWYPQPQFEGYHGILHGGISALLQDEVAAWIIYTKLNTSGVTVSINTRYKKPVETRKGQITIRAQIVSVNRKLATIKTEIENHNGELACEGEIIYVLASPEDARKKHHYPGQEAFFE